MSDFRAALEAARENVVEARHLRPRDVIERDGRVLTVTAVRREHGWLLLKCAEAIGPRGEPRGETYGGWFGYRTRFTRVRRAPHPAARRWSVGA